MHGILTPAQDEARFMRIRLNRYELMITPGAQRPRTQRAPLTSTDERYILVVIHEPPK